MSNDISNFREGLARNIKNLDAQIQRTVEAEAKYQELLARDGNKLTQEAAQRLCRACSELRESVGVAEKLKEHVQAYLDKLNDVHELIDEIIDDLKQEGFE